MAAVPVYKFNKPGSPSLALSDTISYFCAVKVDSILSADVISIP